MILYKIRNADAIIAETTNRNPNVLYELGFSHGIEKETIILCKNSDPIPFDLKSINHVIYNSIVDLRDKLRNRLKSIFDI